MQICKKICRSLPAAAKRHEHCCLVIHKARLRRGVSRLGLGLVALRFEQRQEVATAEAE